MRKKPRRKVKNHKIRQKPKQKKTLRKVSKRKKQAPRRRPKPAIFKKVVNSVPASHPGFVPTINELGSLPFSYNETKLVLLLRDPWWSYAYWDLSTETWQWLKKLEKQSGWARTVLRIKNLDRNTYYDLDVQIETKNWYICLDRPDTLFEAELGLIDSKGHYYLIAQSNQIKTPRSRPVDVVDQKWQPDRFEEIYRISGGKGNEQNSSDVFTQFKKR